MTVVADGTTPFTVASQRFGEQIAVSLAACLEPDGVIVVLADVGNLNVAHNFAVIHHSQATGPTVIEHPRLGDAFWAAHEYSQGFSTFIHYFVAGVAEGITIFGHELELFLEFFGSPEVVAVKKCYPFAFCLCEGSVARDGSSAVLGVFEVMDF